MSDGRGSHPDIGTLSVADFRAKVAGHLSRAQRKIPHALPHDVFDEAITPMMDELNDLDEFLYGFGYDERQQEDTERTVVHKREAKRKQPKVEELAMLLDHRVQKAMEALGVDRSAFLLLPMEADMLADVFVRFLDLLPADAFAEGRCIPPDFPASRDETVAALIALMRDRKARAL